jgi:hypothetical protein
VCLSCRRSTAPTRGGCAVRRVFGGLFNSLLVPRVPFGLGETVQDDLFELLECDMCDFMAIRSIDDVVRIAAHERRRRIM